MKKLLILLFALTCAVLLAQGGPGSAKTVKLGWDTNTETDLAGYVLYWGIVLTGITNSIGVATNGITIQNLANGQYWFAVTAKNTNQLESGFSNILLVSIPRNPTNLKIVP